MIATKKSHSLSFLVCAVLLLTYCAGYAKIRMDCENFGSSFFIVPQYVTASSHLRTIYRPCFLMDGKFTGHSFTTTPWGLCSP